MYKTTWQIRGKHHESEPFAYECDAFNTAVIKARERGVQAVTIVRQSDDNFHPHPDNAGKFYLWRIVK